jgi:histidyl-tRNA synthetase
MSSAPETDSRALQAVKGMNDLLPPDSAKWNHVERVARGVFESYGYREVRTPIVEYTPLFVRSIGEATDVVEKEMYTFTDRDGKSLTMRPEGTASAVRALLEHSVLGRSPQTRWYYSGPMFRHERAQKGRYRQFYQMGVEAYGVAEPSLDAEQVAMLHALYVRLGITGLEVVVNSVGGPEDRPAYREALVAYFTPRRAELCPDCQRRLDRNPMRILDCKVPACQAIAEGAPSTIDHLTPASAAHFTGFKAALDALGVPYRVEPRLVRGLDYYTGPVFELRATSGDLGAQNTLGAGGRYDRLVEELGGPATPAVGFAFGVERVVLTIPQPAESYELGTEVFLVAQGDAPRLASLRLAQQLRDGGYRVDLDHRGGSFKSQFKRADKSGAKVVLVIGDAELTAGNVMLKDMATGEQRPVALGDAAAELAKLLRSSR